MVLHLRSSYSMRDKIVYSTNDITSHGVNDPSTPENETLALRIIDLPKITYKEECDHETNM